MENTIITQGVFTQGATASVIHLPIRSDIDWMYVYNETVLNDAALAADNGAIFYWRRGMTQGRGLEIRKLGTVANDPLTTLQIAVDSGFTLIDSSSAALGTRSALTAITAANPPVITTAATLPSVGSIVRLDTLDNQAQIAGTDFSVTASGGGTFTIGNINLTNSTASTSGFWRVIPFDPMFYPRRRTITYISSETQAKIYLSVAHQFTIGQKVRLQLPSSLNAQGSTLYGDYVAMDDVQVTILDINVTRAGNEPNNAGTANNIVVDFDTSGFTSWETTFGAATNEAFPASGDVPFSPPQVVPLGQDTGYSLNPVDMTLPIVQQNILGGATENRAFLGMELAIGANSPGGQANDVISWRAGKSFSANEIVPLTII